MAAVTLKNLVKRFGDVAAVNDVSLEVPDGALLSLLGASGCGKTTTLRCIAGLERNDGGAISIGDTVVSDPDGGHFVAPNRRKIGMVFQSYAIWPHMTVAENVGYPLRMARTPRGDRHKRVMEALELVELAPYASRQATMLSGGQQQRVALARAVVGEPQLLLFDEPLSNLDAKLRDQTRFELRNLQQRLRTTAVYVTHDQAEAMAISDYVAVMHAGELQQLGTPHEVYSSPVSSFVARFIGAANLIPLASASPLANGSVSVRSSGGTASFVAEPPVGAGGDVRELRFLCLRPEDATVVPADQEAPDTGTNSFEALLTRTVYLGERQECWIDFEDAEYRLFAPARARLTAGERVRVEFDPARCTLLRD